MTGGCGVGYLDARVYVLHLKDEVYIGGHPNRDPLVGLSWKDSNRPSRVAPES